MAAFWIFIGMPVAMTLLALLMGHVVYAVLAFLFGGL